MNTSLNAARRIHELDQLGSASAPVDVLVIGGGVTGTGVALDAAARGLSVVLAEKHDLAFGTSRWSSKLVHGGLRYLASGQIGIAHESAVERDILISRTAPHLVRAFPQIVPLHSRVSTANALVTRAGMLAGDALRAASGTSASTLPRSRRVTPAEVARYAPTVRVTGLRGGVLGWDGQLDDDARLVVALARTAAGHGAKILTRVTASEVTGGGAVLTDTLTGRTLDLGARIVINAAGVWAGEIAPGLGLRPSRGTHLVLSQQVLGGLSAGLMVPLPGQVGRYVFALPAPDGRVYIGLTDEDAPGPIPDEPRPAESEITFLLDTINLALATRIRREDVLGTFSGLRPLFDSGTGTTADISRRHQVITAPDGLLTIVGGKLTTYRRMAQDALDTALHNTGITAGPCRTRRLPLVGAASLAGLDTVQAPTRLLRRYGTEAPQVLAVGGSELHRPISEATELTPAELLFAVRHEGALDTGDLLDRRTRIGLDPVARATAEHTAAAMLAKGMEA
ncbi:glycerol-3-phosphate dehydrogenase [Spinactinospora alkalitolerans]|uniref:Glycerol-3-phosphate dehydrogenase n=1 Tax=Spinactinospora alkalitolerans TaxID=687207 RepID=A0A852TYP8_9ACTN|nr:glycerol-3-phosphate dehydrogenase/oxidase [Spinactinospora alkalitolerans]NYE48465.1 glycerol-3-phosphate dehydrogenase [Spinactinospora alkalitolerans]